MSETPKTQTVMLPVSTSVMKRMLETAQHEALMLALKVDELQLMVDHLQKEKK